MLFDCKIGGRFLEACNDADVGCFLGSPVPNRPSPVTFSQKGSAPFSPSNSASGTMSMASHGQPSRNAPSGPLLVHSLQPMQSKGSTIIRPNGAWSSSGAQYMQSATGQYSTQAGEPAHPVQHSLMTARMWGLRFLWVVVPVEMGAYLTTVPA